MMNLVYIYLIKLQVYPLTQLCNNHNLYLSFYFEWLKTTIFPVPVTFCDVSTSVVKLIQHLLPVNLPSVRVRHHTVLSILFHLLATSLYSVSFIKLLSSLQQTITAEHVAYQHFLLYNPNQVSFLSYASQYSSFLILPVLFILSIIIFQSFPNTSFFLIVHISEL